jgi:hypothetical protein
MNRIVSTTTTNTAKLRVGSGPLRNLCRLPTSSLQQISRVLAIAFFVASYSHTMESAAQALPFKDHKAHRAFYFDSNGNLLNVEMLDDVSIRYLQKHRTLLPYGTSGASAKPLVKDMPITNACSSDGDFQNIDLNARYAIYFGYTALDDGRDHRPQRNYPELRLTKMYEEVIPANTTRLVECAKEDTSAPCQFPKTCHCTTGTCCCY